MRFLDLEQLFLCSTTLNLKFKHFSFSSQIQKHKLREEAEKQLGLEKGK